MFKIIIYNDDIIQYFKGDIQDLNFRQDEPIEYTSIYDNYRKFLPGMCKYFEITTSNSECMDNIELDETTMRRIAKYNKEKELQKIEEKIKEKQNKIKELDDILQDRQKRVEKLKKYITKIYDIDIADHEDDYEDYDY